MRGRRIGEAGTMDDSVMAAGFHPGSAVLIGDPDPSNHHRHNHHHPLPQHMPCMPSAASHTQHMPPMPAALPGGGLFDAPIAQKGIPANPLGGKVVSPSAANTPSDDEDEPGDAADDARADSGKPKKGSPWHRMKWTDEMVTLLIAIVSYVGDDGAPEAADASRRRSGAALQKKGKWKAVSRLMLEKDCYVSPQQCEDKFNDLNKRYKRLNEILGRGTTCQVVENPALLDSMPHISSKAKEDVRKILSSKHLFYREMCAYHNGPRMSGTHDLELHAPAAPSAGSEEDDDDEDDDNGNGEEGSDGFGKRACESLGAEIDGVLQDKMKSRVEQLEWFRERALQLQEERVEIEAEALELEKRRFKWQRFRGKKDREMERLRLGNERLMLENERMVMQVRKKELELEHRRHGELMGLAGFRMDREQGRDFIELS